jgi:hypothetical protein
MRRSFVCCAASVCICHIYHICHITALTRVEFCPFAWPVSELHRPCLHLRSDAVFLRWLLENNDRASSLLHPEHFMTCCDECTLALYDSCLRVLLLQAVARVVSVHTVRHRTALSSQEDPTRGRKTVIVQQDLLCRRMLPSTMLPDCVLEGGSSSTSCTRCSLHADTLIERQEVYLHFKGEKMCQQDGITVRLPTISAL